LASPSPTNSTTISSTFTPNGGIPIRRVRHSEVVLVDQVSIAHGVYWLRLKWPGSRGGVAGYMDIGNVASVSQESLGRWTTLTSSTSGQERGGGSSATAAVRNSSESYTRLLFNHLFFWKWNRSNL
jgi:hypothetical protein